MPITKVAFDTAIDLETTARQAVNVAQTKRESLRALIDSWGVLADSSVPGQAVTAVIVNHEGTLYRVTRSAITLVEADTVTTV